MKSVSEAVRSHRVSSAPARTYGALAATDGNDTLLGTDGPDTLDGVAGDDSLSGLGDHDVLIGNSGADTLDGAAGDDMLYAGSGSDLVLGGTGFDMLIYDSPYGELAGSPQQGLTVDLVTGLISDGWGGQDTVSGVEWVIGSVLADTMSGTASHNEFSGGESADTLLGAGGHDVLYGGTGNDRLVGGAGFDTVYGDDGSDILRGEKDSDQLLGGAGEDKLLGGGGNDTLYPGSGDDLIDGGAGVDTVRYDNGMGGDPAGPAIQGAVIDLVAGTAVDCWGGLDQLSNVESATGNVLGDRLQGNAGANGLEGFEGDDTVQGGDGNDSLGGNSGADSLSGGAGGDYLNPGSGDDIVDGGPDFDLLLYDDTFNGDAAGAVTQAVLVDLAQGSATDNWGGHDSVSGVEYVAGGTLNDTLRGGTSAMYLYGRGGTDSITGSTAGDVLRGEDGDDTVNGAAGNDPLVAGDAGNDSLTGGGGDDTLFGNAGNDTMRGGSGDDLLFLSSGDDLLDGGAGIDTAIFNWGYEPDLGGDPNQGLVVDLAAGTLVDGWGGHDTITGIERVVGSDFGDILIGDAQDNNLEGGAGDDEIQGGTGTDTASYAGASGQVTINLAVQGSPQDTGTAGIDTLVGIENVEGSDFADDLAGSAGENVLDGGAGIDTMSGGDGDDTYYVDDEADEVIEAPPVAARHALGDASEPDPRAGGSNIDTVIAQVSYTLRANVENLQLLGTAGLTATGNELNNLLSGNGGHNLLRGLAGVDILGGGTGDDTLDGGSGSDTLGGGAGNDVYLVDTANDVILPEGATQGSDTVRAAVNWVLGAGLEVLALESGALNGTGNTAANTLNGNALANVLRGLEGNDALQGFAGTDRLYGGAGRDTLSGGADIDRFVFDTALASDNIDEVSDFAPGTDKILLDMSIFATIQQSASTPLTAAAFYASTSSVAHDADDRILYNTGTGALFYDPDGTGAQAPIRFATIGATTHPTLTAGDFVVIA